MRIPLPGWPKQARSGDAIHPLMVSPEGFFS
jgi:hypothetical protein